MRRICGTVPLVDLRGAGIRGKRDRRDPPVFPRRSSSSRRRSSGYFSGELMSRAKLRITCGTCANGPGVAEFLRCAREQTSDLRLLRLRKMMEPLGEKRKCLSGRGQEALPCPHLLGDRNLQVLLKTFDLPGTGCSPALRRGQDGAFRRLQLKKAGAVAGPDELRLRPNRWRPGRGVRPHRPSEGC